MTMSLARAGTAMEIRQEVRVLEDMSGLVRNFVSETRTGGHVMKVSGSVTDGMMTVDHGRGPTTAPYPDGALGPRALDARTRALGLKAGAKGNFLSFDPNDPEKPITTSTEVVGPESKEVLGTVHEAILTTTLTSQFPNMPLKGWVDDQGEFLAGQVPLGGLGMLEILRTTQELATGQKKPQELFLPTLIRPDRSIPSPEKWIEASYRISLNNGKNLELPSGVGQAVESLPEGGLRVTVAMPTAPPAEALFQMPISLKEEWNPFLESSRYIDWNHPKVRAMAEAVIGDRTQPLEIAKRIESEVYRRIKNKDLATGFATASQTAETLSGDCTEHAVLAAALARAAGLPSRVVSGLVYVPTQVAGVGKDVFGFHMWTEIMIGPDLWWPVDGAFNRFDVTHIAFQRTALGEMNPEVELAMPILEAMGQTRLEVLETK
jgi:hypothetical protein